MKSSKNIRSYRSINSNKSNKVPRTKRSRKSHISIFSDEDDGPGIDSKMKSNRTIKLNVENEYDKKILDNYDLKRSLMPINNVANLNDMDFENDMSFMTQTEIKRESIYNIYNPKKGPNALTSQSQNLIMPSNNISPFHTLEDTHSKIIEKTVKVDPETGLKTFTTVRRSVSRKKKNNHLSLSMQKFGSHQLEDSSKQTTQSKQIADISYIENQFSQNSKNNLNFKSPSLLSQFMYKNNTRPKSELEKVEKINESYNSVKKPYLPNSTNKLCKFHQINLIL